MNPKRGIKINCQHSIYNYEASFPESRVYPPLLGMESKNRGDFGGVENWHF